MIDPIFPPPLKKMKGISRISIFMILAISRVFGEPTGICLFAASPESPPGEVQAFEFERYERLSDAETLGEGFRFHPAKGETVVITKYKFRGIIPYPSQIVGADPKLPKQMESFKAYAVKYPRSQRFLNPFIDKMAGVLAAKTDVKDENTSLPTLKIGTDTFYAPSFAKVSDGKVTIKHRDGFTGLPIKKLTEIDIAAINKLSDGSWRLCRPTLTGFNPASNKYKTLTLSNGVQHRDVEFISCDKGQVLAVTASKELTISLSDIEPMTGFAEVDHQRVNQWINDLARAKTKAAETEFSKGADTPPPKPISKPWPERPVPPYYGPIQYGPSYYNPYNPYHDPPVSSLQRMGGG